MIFLTGEINHAHSPACATQYHSYIIFTYAECVGYVFEVHAHGVAHSDYTAFTFAQLALDDGAHRLVGLASVVIVLVSLLRDGCVERFRSVVLTAAQIVYADIAYCDCRKTLGLRFRFYCVVSLPQTVESILKNIVGLCVVCEHTACHYVKPLPDADKCFSQYIHCSVCFLLLRRALRDFVTNLAKKIKSRFYNKC